MKKPQEAWEERFDEEFGVHFKDSSGELQFAKAFIHAELQKAREEGYEAGKNAVKVYPLRITRNGQEETIDVQCGEAIANYREEWVQKIKDSLWVCPSHEEVDPIQNRGCTDCSEAASVNIILLNLLQSPPQENG